MSIVCRKDNKNLKPNIYINTKFLSLGETIRGNIAITCFESGNFKSLSKVQTIKLLEFLKNASFNYANTKSIDNVFENFESIDKLNKDNIDKETLEMILNIQASILKFIQVSNKK